MRPDRLFGLHATAFLIAAAFLAPPAASTPADLDTLTYYGDYPTCVNPSSSVPVFVKAVPRTSVCPAQPTSHTCAQTTSGSSLYPVIDCSTSDGTTSGTFETNVDTLFSTNPYVIVEKYQTGFCSDLTKFDSISAYLADGKCHKLSSTASSTPTSYRATRKADKSAFIQQYTDAACGTAGTSLSVTASQGTQNACPTTTDNTGIKDTIIYGAGATVLQSLTATTVYGSTGDCTTPSVASVPVIVTVVPVASGCVASTTCAESNGLYPAISCSDTDGGPIGSFEMTSLPTLFGSNPYVVVEKYVSGQGCSDVTKLSSITAYSADGKCHKATASTSYRATRRSDKSAFIQQYTDAACGTAGTSLSVTASQGTQNACPTTTDNTGIKDTIIYGAGATVLQSLTATTVYGSTGDCTTPSVASVPVIVTVVPATSACTASTTCAASNGLYPAISCSDTDGGPIGSFEMTSLPTLFGSNPYVVVEKYQANAGCSDVTKLSSIMAYLADGKCHPVDISTSYRAIRKADSSAIVVTYTDAVCSTGGTTLSVTTTQGAGNACPTTTDSTGIADTKIYGSGISPLVLSSSVSYDTNANDCQPPAVPSQITATLSSLPCSPSLSCSGSVAPFTTTTCGLTSTFKTDVANMFGSNPYVIVESYTSGQSCVATSLSGVMAYVADGKCHKMASTSYRAIRKADNSAVVVTYTDAVCSTGGTPLIVTADQGDPTNGNKCDGTANGIPNTLIYGSGSSPLFLKSVVSYDSTCTSSGAVPSLVTTTVENVNTCSMSSSCSSSPFSTTMCSSRLTHKSDTTSLFGSNPYVIIETYSDGKCDAAGLSGIKTYLADGSCHTAGATNFKATRKKDGSAVIQTYTNTACTTPDTLVIVTAAQASGNSCANDGKGLLNTKVYGGGSTVLYLSSTVNYDGNTNSCNSPDVPSQLITSVVAAGACTATPASTCAGTAAPFTATTCGLASTYKTDVATLLSSNPYVIVEEYAAGKNCDPTELIGMTTYLADGKCHPAGLTSSTRAIRNLDGSATVNTYADSSCGVGATTLSVSNDQVQGNVCLAGIVDTKVYTSSAKTPMYLLSISSYDSNTGDCQPTATPTQVVTNMVAGDACTTTTSCSSGSAPYTSSKCSSISTFEADIATTLGATPYVIVEKYAAGTSCAAAQLSTVTTYIADGACHKTSALTSYTATRMSDGSAVIQPYTDAVCGTAAIPVIVTTAMGDVATGGNSCKNDGMGLLDTKIVGGGSTATVFKSTVNYDASTAGCQSPDVPSQLVTSVSPTTDCSATSSCTGSGPYSVTMCTSTLSYKTDVASTFGSNPYVIVESYTAGKSCSAGMLSSVTTYLADGKCHQTGASAWVTATRLVDGSAAIQLYSDSICNTTTGTALTLTATQVTGNSCANDANGIVDTKVFGSGVTPLYLSLVGNYDATTNNCQSPDVPSLLAATVVTPGACTATTTCNGTAAPYTSIGCSSTLSYKTDVATAFGSNPYVIVEKYATGTSCGASQLSSFTVYLADSKCHKTASGSYKAIRNVDGSATIQPYTDALCATAGTLWTVTATQATGNSCANDANGIVDTKVYGGGATSVLKTVVTYGVNTNACKSPDVPSLLATTVVTAGSCTAATACTTAPYTATICSSPLTYKTNMATVFTAISGNTLVSPYVVVEKYTAGTNCDITQLASLTTYVADSKCHKVSSTSSYRVTRAADGTTVIQPYTDALCTAAGTPLTVAAAQSTGNSCANDGKGIVDTKIYGFGVSALYLSSTVNYDSSKNGCMSPDVPSLLATTPVAAGACSALNTCSGSGPFTATVCSSTLAYKADTAAMYGSNPYIMLEKYTSGTTCEPSTLTEIKTYLADGNCHKTASASYRATRKSDGSALIQPYTDTACSTAGTLVTVTAAQATGNSCTATANGILDTKVYGSGTSALFLNSVLTFDSNAGGCSQPSVPSQVASSVVTLGLCTATSSCSGSGPYTSTKCGSRLTYQSDIATLFGTNPYVVIEKYTTAKNCDATQLSAVTAYLADGKCHKTASVSYRATRKADGSALIQPYTDAACSTAGTLVTVTAAQATGNSCASGANGIVDTKVYGSGSSPLYLKSIANYDSNTGACKSPAVPSLLSTTVANLDSCAATSICSTGSAPFTSTKCGSIATYKLDVATMFGSTPYVAVEQYTAGTNCVREQLLNIIAYQADGKCHKTAASASYRATRMADGSAFIQPYTDAACTVAGALVTITKAQALGNSCANDVNGIVDTKVFGGGVTVAVFKSTISYDTSAICQAPGVPSLLVTTVAAADGCSMASGCGGSPPTVTTCTSTLTYKTDVANMFGSNPYVIVETYTTGQTCAATALTGITTYSADGKCHKGTTGSYTATRSSDTSATITTYTDVACSASSPSVLTVAANQGNACTTNTKVYGGGATPLYLTSVVNYEASGCTSVPSQVATSVVTSTPCAIVACAGSGPYSKTTCSSTLAYKADVATMFGSSAYVIIETYTGSACSTLSSIATYSADGKCHKNSGSTYYIATRSSDGSAVVTPYASVNCPTPGTPVVTVTAAQGTSNACTSNMKVYGSGATSLLQSVLTYDTITGGCVAPVVPSQLVTTTVAAGACSAATSCSGSAPFTVTICSSTLTYKSDMAAVFVSGSRVNPYVIVEKYTATNCAGTPSTTTYVADGKCHTTDQTSYRATRLTDGSAFIQPYTDTACTTPGTLWTVTAAQASGNSCANDANGIVNTKVYGAGATSVSLSSVVNYDANSIGCKSPDVPSLLATTVVDTSGSPCASTSTCSGSVAPYSATACSTTLTYKTDVAAMFGSTPYVIVEKYNAGKKCDVAELSGIMTYAADGMCHQTDTEASYRALRSLDGTVTVKTYSAAADCSGDPTTTLSVTTAQAKGNSCASDANGMADTKIFGNGFSPLYLSTGNYDTNTGGCKAPAIPTQQIASVVTADTCSATSSCAGTVAPFSAQSCSPMLTYKTDTAATFGQNPYVLVEKYTAGTGCVSGQLPAITTYLADGKCHLTNAASSYRAVKASDGSSTIKAYADSSCNAAWMTLVVNATQAAGNLCTTGIIDTKVYGGGVTSTVLSGIAAYDDSTCSTPSQLVITSGASCTAATCTVSGGRSISQVCAPDQSTVTQAVFGNTKPYILVEVYMNGTSCGTKQGTMAYAADANCHLAMDGTSSFKVTLGANGAGAMAIYTDTACQDAAPVTTALTSDMLSSHSCTGNTKYYGMNAPTTSAPTSAPVTNAPSTDAPTSAPTSAPTPTTTTSTSTGKSDAASLFPTSTLLVTMMTLLAWATALLR